MEKKDLIRLFEETIEESKIINMAEEVIRDLKTLNRILFSLQENFNLSESRLREMSESTDSDIIALVDRIEFNLKKISQALKTETQVTPFNKEEMDRVMVGIMAQYMTTSMNIKLDAVIGESYSMELNKIHSALSDLSTSINNYNTFARDKNWPEIISENEALIIAKQYLP
jgi:hypothetical protein